MNQAPARIGFRIIGRFDPTSEAWPGYVQWIKLVHLTEVVGLDCALCPTAAVAESDLDWQRSVYVEYVSGVFDDWGYALGKVPQDSDLSRLQLIAVLREPAGAELQASAPDGFDHLGFDLIEEATGISALTNCGDAFGLVLSPSDLNAHGLVANMERAYAIRDQLLQEYPDEPHADCTVWAIWRRSERLTRACI
jgi:hypothetical protein